MGHDPMTDADRRVHAARQSLAERLNRVEDRVTGTVHGVTDAVGDVKDSVRSAVTGISDRAKTMFDHSADAVQEALDVRRHVRAHPWEGALTAVATGFFAGLLTRRAKSPAPQAAAASSQPSITSELWTRIRREITALGEHLIERGSQAARQQIEALASTAAQTPIVQSLRFRRSAIPAAHGNGWHTDG